MSMKLIESEIRRFLSTTEPEAICISGHWGVGKTYAWNRFLKDVQTAKKIALPRYSYVSLFGINSLDELKYSVFENSVSSSQIGVEPSLETLQSNTKATAERFGRKSLWFVQQIPLVKNYVGGLGPVWFLSVKSTIICIDDIERRGKGLTVRDVMGLASHLKEHKSCKIVLILNDDGLEEDKKEFETYYEKVVDSTLRFAPTAQECARIALAGNTLIDQLQTANCVTLGISNIRLVKKIERAIRTIEPLLKPYDGQVLKQAAQSLTLFAWSLYERKKAPPIDYLMKHNAAQYLLPKGEKAISENEAAWNALLEAYHFTNMDEFDLVLRDGYFDTEAIQKHAAALDKTIKATTRNNSFSQAWRLFHDSLENNEKEVLDGIYSSFISNIQSIAPMNLDGTVRLFKELGRAEQAAEMIKTYMDAHSDDQKLFDLQNYPFTDNIRDPDVIRAFNEKFATFKDERNPAEVLLSVGQGWNSEDLSLLATLPADDYYAIFKKSDPESLPKLINNGLQFDRIENATPPMKEISRRVREALKRIAEESRINARRMAKYGITLEQTGPAQPAANPEGKRQ